MSRRNRPTVSASASASVLIAMLLWACGPAASSVAPATVTPSNAPPGVATAAFSSASGSPTGPSFRGAIAFDRFEGTRGLESTHLGTFITVGNSIAERRLPVPASVDSSVPVWSPDGGHLLLNLFILPDGPGRPGIIGADGMGFRIVEPKGLGGDLLCSDWSLDGGTLLCSVGSGDHHDIDGIYTIRSDGSHLTRLTRSPFHDTLGSAGECGGGESRGKFSPDGTQIAFIRQKCGSGPDPSSDESAAIELMNSDGSGLHEIVPQGAVRSHPGSAISWSPDGMQLAFGSQNGELLLVHPDGTALGQIPLPAGLGQHAAYGPAWSPDGSRIVFSMYLTAADSTDLYVISPDGSALTKLTDAPGVEGYPSWGPVTNP